MIPNSKSENIIHLTDKMEYKAILASSVVELQSMEIKLKEIGLNLLTKSEYSNWDKNVDSGHIEELDDSVFENSSDKYVKEFYKLATITSDLLERISKDKKI